MDFTENDIQADTGVSLVDAWVNGYLTMNFLFASVVIAFFYTGSSPPGASPIALFFGAFLGCLLWGTVLKWVVRRVRSRRSVSS